MRDTAQGVYATLTALLDRLDSGDVTSAEVIAWASPVPAFGDLSNARIATLGLNPSNREFVDSVGNELEGVTRRFHTLASLGLQRWADADLRHLRLILDSCDTYFTGNPYDRWFRVLEQVLTASGSSYYSHGDVTACHLDLIPYATSRKWMDLSLSQRRTLIDFSGDALGRLLRESAIRCVILNGRTVTEHFADIFDVTFDAQEMPDWSLPRSSGRRVPGFAYTAKVPALAGVDLGRDVLVLGYNHNLQSSYGVTSKVISMIGDWVAGSLKGRELL